MLLFHFHLLDHQLLLIFINEDNLIRDLKFGIKFYLREWKKDYLTKLMFLISEVYYVDPEKKNNTIERLPL